MSTACSPGGSSAHIRTGSPARDARRAHSSEEGPSMKTFRNKVAVVTGAASGIGLAMAKRFGAEGMNVVLADVEESALDRAEAEVRALGAATLAVRTDVAQASNVEALAKRTLERFGAVHLVCNNAGVGGDGALAWEQTLESWKWVIDVNLWGVIHGIRTFMP